MTSFGIQRTHCFWDIIRASMFLLVENVLVAGMYVAVSALLTYGNWVSYHSVWIKRGERSLF